MPRAAANPVEDELLRNGFLIRDGLLARPLFERVQRRALDAWAEPRGWVTRVKGRGDPVLLPFQNAARLKRIRALLGRQRSKRAKEFTYLYHALREGEARPGLANVLARHVVKGWAPEIGQLGLGRHELQFSLTAYTPHCFLGRHTDFSPGHQRPYRLALILYLQCPRSTGREGCLEFDYRGQKAYVDALPNRSVLSFRRDKRSIPSCACRTGDGLDHPVSPFRDG